MAINPTSPNFFPCLMEKYHDKIITPYKNGKELFATLESLYTFEAIDYEETIPEMRGFVIDKNITKERCDAYLLKSNNSSELFYKYHAARFFPRSKIFLLVDKNNDEFIANDHLFQTKINILRGIDKMDIDNFTQAFKVYLNLFYLYDSEKNKEGPI